MVTMDISLQLEVFATLLAGATAVLVFAKWLAGR